MCSQATALAAFVALVAVPAAYWAGEARGAQQAGAAAVAPLEEKYGRRLELLSRALLERMGERANAPALSEGEAPPGDAAAP